MSTPGAKAFYSFPLLPQCYTAGGGQEECLQFPLSLAGLNLLCTVLQCSQGGNEGGARDLLSLHL
jgi:hypothetical protein